MEVTEAYGICRGIARREAKNFYYSFIALPRAKRDAICAVYAFMRHADDLSDDESLPIGQRMKNLEQWLSQWRLAAAGGINGDPIFIALSDAQSRFRIPTQLLEQLVEGTTMDLRRPQRHSGSQEPAYDTYETFEDLYRYCYLVASVVGLVCIRIFGYEDKDAERLAEETGVAFQLTNILRDVREDESRGRVYLPLEDLRHFNITAKELGRTAETKVLSRPVREVLQFEALRADKYYQSGMQLLPLVAADSRPALWVLITIYRRLLRRINSANYDVFSKRISVPTIEKLAILGWGIFRTLGVRSTYRRTAGRLASYD